MSDSPPIRKGQDKKPAGDRRAPSGARGLSTLLRRLKGLFGRPVRLERRGLQWHLVVVDRRHPGAANLPPTLSHLRAELRARLLALDHEVAATVMRQLVVVHDELRRRGWPGVEALSSPVLVKALAQAQMLAEDEPSPAMAMIVERLRLMHAAAQSREEREAKARLDGSGGQPEVSETTFDQFEAVERSWVGTIPGALRLVTPRDVAG
jgi:hypothetical protein